MAAITTLLLGGIALLGGGLFASSLVASIATPVALILAGVAGASTFIKTQRQQVLDQYFSSEEGLFLGLGLLSATVFFLTFVVTQSLVAKLSPLAGILVIGLGVAVFFAGPGVLIDLFEVVAQFFGGEN